MHVRRCPQCGSDYRPEIVSCADCGVLLEDWDDELDDPSLAPETSANDLAVAPEGFEPVLSAHSVRDLQPFADRLIEAGIECRLRESRSGGHVIGYRLFVHASESARAAESLAQCLTEGCGVSLLHNLQGPFDPEEGYRHCPACGTELQKSALACPECDLPLATPEDVCPDCGQARDREPDSRCHHCGHVFGPGD